MSQDNSKESPLKKHLTQTDIFQLKETAYFNKIYATIS